MNPAPTWARKIVFGYFSRTEAVPERQAERAAVLSLSHAFLQAIQGKHNYDQAGRPDWSLSGLAPLIATEPVTREKC